MHEYSLCSDIFKQVIEKSKENELKKITKISIKIGEASGIDQEFMRHSILEHLFSKSIKKDVEVEFIIEKVSLKCKKCGNIIKNIDKKSQKNKCDICKNEDFEINSGQSIYLNYIEGEKE